MESLLLVNVKSDSEVSGFVESLLLVNGTSFSGASVFDALIDTQHSLVIEGSGSFLLMDTERLFSNSIFGSIIWTNLFVFVSTSSCHTSSDLASSAGL